MLLFGPVNLSALDCAKNDLNSSQESLPPVNFSKLFELSTANSNEIYKF